MKYMEGIAEMRMMEKRVLSPRLLIPFKILDAPCSVLVVCFLTFLLFPVSASADMVFEFEEVYEKTYLPTQAIAVTRSRSTIYVSGNSARHDSGNKSYIYRSDLGKIWLVDRKQETYMEFDTPIKLEDNVSSESMKIVAVGSEAYQSVVEIKLDTEECKNGVFNTRLWKARVTYPNLGSVSEVDVCLTQDLDFEGAIFEELHRNRRALDIRSRKWFHRILELDGIGVQWEIMETSTNANHKMTSKLVRVYEETIGLDHYALPTGFTREEFRLDAMFAIGGKKAESTGLSYSQ